MTIVSVNILPSSDVAALKTKVYVLVKYGDQTHRSQVTVSKAPDVSLPLALHVVAAGATQLAKALRHRG